MSSREDARGGGREGEEPGGESSGGFRVIDRRRFASDGSERDEPAETAPGQHAPQTPPGRTAPPQGDDAPARPTGESDRLGRPVGEAYDPTEGPPLEATFTTLVMSLSTQALLLLGEIQAPGEESPVDLPGARHLIDLLGVLKTKTAGNLDPAEGQILERILYDLRMRFVEISRSTGR